MSNNNIPRMRTIPEAVKLLQELDSSTAITLRAVRRMVNAGQLPVTMVGSKRLINFDKLLDLLENPEEKAAQPDYGKIRRIDERGVYTV